MSISNNYPNVRPSLLLDFANTKTLDPRITFTRASTATYYDGKTVAKAEENLFLYSEQFDNAYWIKEDCSVTANTTAAPNGTSTADTVTLNATTNRHRVYTTATTVTSSSYAQSWFVKANTHNFVQLAVNNQPADFANFDLSTGTIGTTGGAGTTATIVSLGNGWYRLSIVYTASGTQNDGTLSFVPSSSASRLPSWTATGTESIFIWGGQMEQRSSVTAYTPTTTAPITNYIPALQTAASGVARFDHNPTTGESLGLLIEESRTNLLSYSSGFDNAAWTKLNTTITADTIVAPDGTQTGDKIIASNAAGGKVIYQTVSAGTVTASVYAKAGEMGGLALAFGPAGTWFNLTTGAIRGYYNATPTSSTITPVGNGWYRCSITVTLASADGLYIGPNDNVSNSLGSTLTGNGFSGIYIWGAQLEAGSFATSYIPTTSATVTRSQDLAVVTGTNFSSWYSSREGTFYAQAKSNYHTTSTGGNRYLLANTSTNSYYLYNNQGSGSVQNYDGANINGVAVSDFTATNKYATSYGTSSKNLVVNGGSVSSGPYTQNWGANNALAIGSLNTSGGALWNGTIAKIAYYPKQLTNAELQGLTTI